MKKTSTQKSNTAKLSVNPVSKATRHGRRTEIESTSTMLIMSHTSRGVEFGCRTYLCVVGASLGGSEALARVRS